MPRDEPPPAAPTTQGSERPAQQQSAPAPTGTSPAQGTAPAPATGAPAQAPASGTGTTASGPGQLTGPPPGSQLSGGLLWLVQHAVCCRTCNILSAV